MKKIKQEEDKFLLTKFNKEIVVTEFTKKREKYYNISKEVLRDRTNQYYKVVPSSHLRRFKSLVRKQKVLSRQMQNELKKVFENEPEE